jgi:hypothetical protein
LVKINKSNLNRTILYKLLLLIKQQIYVYIYWNYVIVIRNCNNSLKIHGQFKRPINSKTELLKVKAYNEVFVGHTTTQKPYPDMKPVHASNVWNLDQGAGWSGKLTLMNIDTKEYFQSDLVTELYPDELGRMG